LNQMRMKRATFLPLLLAAALFNGCARKDDLATVQKNGATWTLHRLDTAMAVQQLERHTNMEFNLRSRILYCAQNLGTNSLRSSIETQNWLRFAGEPRVWTNSDKRGVIVYDASPIASKSSTNFAALTAEGKIIFLPKHPEGTFKSAFDLLR
jgi:hypothetical protein